jgi:hypothetical protein
MATVKMGFEGQIFYGAAGSTATTQITNATDINFPIDQETGNTTVRGDGSSIPIETMSVTCLKGTIEFSMIFDTADTTLAALMTAAAAGSGVALRLKDYASGKGPDADYILKVENGMPLKGEQTKKFTATPTRGYGRNPQIYV